MNLLCNDDVLYRTCLDLRILLISCNPIVPVNKIFNLMRNDATIISRRIAKINDRVGGLVDAMPLTTFLILIWMN